MSVTHASRGACSKRKLAQPVNELGISWTSFSRVAVQCSNIDHCLFERCRPQSDSVTVAREREQRPEDLALVVVSLAHEADAGKTLTAEGRSA